MIDPRAVIDSKANIDEDVSIGPFSIIGSDVEIGRGTRIGAHAVINGPCSIGKDNQVFQFTTVGEIPQDKKYNGEATRLEIGDRNVIREYATLHRGTVQGSGVTRIGNDNLFMAYTHVAHDCQIGNHAILANAASMAGHVTIDDYAILGGFTIVHQFCRLGQHSFSAMGSAITRDVPPYVTVGGRPTAPHGINKEGLRRCGYDEDLIKTIFKAYKLLYKSGHTLEEAIGAIKVLASDHIEIDVIVDFLERTERSIIR